MVNRLLRFRFGNSRSAFETKTAFMFAPRNAFSEMVTQFAARESERLGRHHHCRSEAARQPLAIAAMTLQHHDRLGRAFVTNRATRAAAGERNLHRSLQRIGNVSLDEFRQQRQ